MKKISEDTKKKIALVSLAAIAFVAVLISIYVQKQYENEEVAFKEVLTDPSKDAVVEKNEKMLKKFSGTRYVCDDEKFVFVDIYLENDEKKASVALANSVGQYATTKLTEIVGIGSDKKFAGGDSMENSLLITDNENEVQLSINNMVVVKNCIKK